MSVKEETKRLLQRPSVSTLDSESDSQDNHIDSDSHEGHLEQALPLRTTRAGLLVPCTELPAPSMLRDNGYVDVISTQIPKHVVVRSLSQDRQNSRSPPCHLALPHKRTQHSVESNSSTCSPSGNLQPNTPMVSSISNPTSSTNSSQSVSSNHDHSLGILSMSFNLSQDMTLELATYHSPRMSPVEPQPLTMPDIEDSSSHCEFAPAPKSYFVWALCSTVFCCLPVGAVALIISRQVRRHYNRGDLRNAVLASRNVRRWSLIALILGSAMWTVALVVTVVTLVLKF